MASDAVHTSYAPLVRVRYVTDVRGFTDRGDSFTEHQIYISVVLMIVVKYLMGQFFFLMTKFRVIHTDGPQDRSGVKGLRWQSVEFGSCLELPFAFRWFSKLKGWVPMPGGDVE